MAGGPGAEALSGVATRVRLPRRDGSLAPYQLGPASAFQRPAGPIRSRVAIAAAHVVADPLAANIPGGPAHLDWEATLAYRRHLWSWGLGVAEAMDTAQRGMGLDWPRRGRADPAQRSRGEGKRWQRRLGSRHGQPRARHGKDDG